MQGKLEHEGPVVYSESSVSLSAEVHGEPTRNIDRSTGTHPTLRARLEMSQILGPIAA